MEVTSEGRIEECNGLVAVKAPSHVEDSKLEAYVMKTQKPCLELFFFQVLFSAKVEYVYHISLFLDIRLYCTSLMLLLTEAVLIILPAKEKK